MLINGKFDFILCVVYSPNDQSVRLPEGINSIYPAKCLVRTGPSYNDEGCTIAADIEVDLVPPGEYISQWLQQIFVC
jgi:hypothetical protein